MGRGKSIDGIKHTMYADDITIWCPGGSEGYIESVLQEAVDAIETYLVPTGLRCSPAKSALLVYSPTRRGPKPRGWLPVDKISIQLRTRNGDMIPRVDNIRVLGMLIESNGANTLTIAKLIAKTENAVRLVKRVANKQNGLKEDSLIRLMHAFVLCHFTYVAAMHKWKPSEKEKLDTQIRKITKKVLGVPMCTSNERLLQLGIHNTLDEIAEAQERAQMVRLSTTSAGRQILRELGVPQERISLLHVGIPLKACQRYQVMPIPRNMHPERNVGRRKARGACLLRLIRNKNQRVSFVDASFNEERKAFTVVVVDNEGAVVNAASVRTDRPEDAEQAAIALALVDRSRPFVYSDSVSR